MQLQERAIVCSPIFRTGSTAAVGPAVQDKDQRSPATAGAFTEEYGVGERKPTSLSAGATSDQPCLRLTSHNQRRRNVMRWMMKKVSLSAFVFFAFVFPALSQETGSSDSFEPVPFTTIDPGQTSQVSEGDAPADRTEAVISPTTPFILDIIVRAL
jgi:hypothetical protein